MLAIRVRLCTSCAFVLEGFLTLSNSAIDHRATQYMVNDTGHHTFSSISSEFGPPKSNIQRVLLRLDLGLDNPLALLQEIKGNVTIIVLVQY